MITYTYSALNPTTGEKIRAEIQAENEKSAAKLLVDKGLAPLEITVKENKTIGGDRRGRINTKTKVIFSRQLSTLINSGLPLLQSLNTVRNQTTNKAMSDVITKVIADVEGGNSLAQAMEKHPSVFGNVYVNLVAAGEASGSLDVALERIATQQEKDAEVISKVRGAMIYPMIVLVILFGILIFMTTSVLPQVASLYKTLPDAKLPTITVILMNFSHFVTHFWWIVLILLGVSVFFARKYLKTPKGIELMDNIKLNAPPFGPLMKKLYMARFARTGATLVGAGVPMIKMLDTTSEAVGNTLIKRSLDRAAEKVKGGKTLSSALDGDSNFIDLVPNMISIGEQSGSLETMLSRVADYFEKEVDNQIKSINTIIEPVMMVFVGVAALIIVAAVLLPIYGLAGKNLGG